MKALTALFVLLLLAACATPFREDTNVPLVPQPGFDVTRFQGDWYEIARFPVDFLNGCYGTTFAYEPLNTASLSITIQCRISSFDGPLRRISGTARQTQPGQLNAWFVNRPALPMRQTILWVDDRYTTVAIGVPDGRAGWILSRSPQVDPARRAQAETALRANGFDTSRLVETPQLK